MKRYFIAAMFLLVGCAGGREAVDYRTLTSDRAIADAVANRDEIPKAVKVGKPYKVSGKSYTPVYDPDYDEVGLASWYGPGFHGSSTAAGEEYDQYEYTAAHKTLPLPSLVRVTNIENSREIVVRINDRGPFAEKRIIDLSQNAAKSLGMHKNGIAKVRVQYLESETRELWSRLNLVTPVETTQYAAGMGRAAESAGWQVSEKVSLDKVESQSLDELPLASKKYPAERRPVAKLSEIARNDNLAEIQTSAGDGWFVQVATFGQQENAERTAMTLADLGPALLLPVENGGKTMYRVRMGPVESEEACKALKARIAAQGFGDAKIIKPSM